MEDPRAPAAGVDDKLQLMTAIILAGVAANPGVIRGQLTEETVIKALELSRMILDLTVTAVLTPADK